MSTASPLVRFEQNILPRLVVPAMATLLLILVSSGSARAANNTFVIADAEGYGIMDCLTDGKSCGRIVADAWCEAHGFGPASSFGRASDVTGSTPVSVSTGTPNSVPDNATVVACGE